MKIFLSFLNIIITYCALTLFAGNVLSQVTDIDGNVYKVITANNRDWTAENLNVSHYRNGDAIPQIQDNDSWSKLTTGAWCYYDNDSANGKTFGKLYNWYAVNDARGLAPEGWHIPGDSEWLQLIDYLGDYSIAGGKLKAVTLWESPNKGATNEIGFSALPSGLRYDGGDFNLRYKLGYIWTSSGTDLETAVARIMSYGNITVFRFNGYKKDGYVCRCVKD